MCADTAEQAHVTEAEANVTEQCPEAAGMIGDNVITFFLGMLVLEQMKKADADREWVILTTFFFAKLYE